MAVSVPVRSVDGKQFMVEMASNPGTVADLSKLLQEHHNYECDGMKLIYKGKVRDGGETLEQVGFEVTHAFVVVGKRKNGLTATADREAKRRRTERDEEEKQKPKPAPKPAQQPQQHQQSLRQPLATADGPARREARRAAAARQLAMLERAHNQLPASGGQGNLEHLTQVLLSMMEEEPGEEEEEASEFEEFEEEEVDSEQEAAETTAPAPESQTEGGAGPDLTEEDQAAVRRLMELAQVTLDVARHAYLAMGKNETAAANMLFD
ncbi:hypothetical protein DIPPA_12755 [Diplonema papillatum]|nr:hypothetical protein DIPPA_12755 [Diplonema papillatum]